MSMLPILTSLQNSSVKQLVKLRDSRERKTSGLTRIDGARELLRCLESGTVPEVIYICEERVRSHEARAALQLAQGTQAALQPVSEAVYEKILFGDRDEGLCATIRWLPRQLSDPALEGANFILAIEGIEKPGNLGALMRTADGAGVDAIVLIDSACDPSNPNVIRASMGTLFTQPVVVAGAEEFREWARQSNLKLLITRPDAEQLYSKSDLRTPLALVFGSEHSGLTPAWNTAEAVRLPMAGVSDSLNLSASAAILLYEVVRQRA